MLYGQKVNGTLWLMYDEMINFFKDVFPFLPWANVYMYTGKFMHT
jgi:hypothetical protein